MPEKDPMEALASELVALIRKMIQEAVGVDEATGDRLDAPEVAAGPSSGTAGGLGRDAESDIPDPVMDEPVPVRVVEIDEGAKGAFEDRDEARTSAGPTLAEEGPDIEAPEGDLAGFGERDLRRGFKAWEHKKRLSARGLEDDPGDFLDFMEAGFPRKGAMEAMVPPAEGGEFLEPPAPGLEVKPAVPEFDIKLPEIPLDAPSPSLEAPLPEIPTEPPANQPEEVVAPVALTPPPETLDEETPVEALEAVAERLGVPEVTQEMIELAMMDDARPMELPSEFNRVPPKGNNFEDKDPLGIGEHGKQVSDSEFATREIVTEIFDRQVDQHDWEMRMRERSHDFMERVALDNHNSYRRLEHISSSYEKSLDTMTDTNI